MDHLCYVCFVFVMLMYLLIAERERADLLAFVYDVYCAFVTFPFGILGQVWYLIVSIPGPCRLSFFIYFRSMVCDKYFEEFQYVLCDCYFAYKNVIVSANLYLHAGLMLFMISAQFN